MKKRNKIHWVYSSRDNQELEERYDQWARDYDEDLEHEFGWWAPQFAAEVFARHVPKKAKILDAGAGTGLMGQALAKLGYDDITAIDMSRGMLEQARRKNVYRRLLQMVMGEPLDFATGSFDAVASIGVLTIGHAPVSSFDELVRITRLGGHIVFTLRLDVYEGYGFKEKLASLESEGKWRLVEVSERFQGLRKGEPGVYNKVWVYQVSSRR